MRFIQVDHVQDCISFWAWFYWNNATMFRFMGFLFQKKSR